MKQVDDTDHESNNIPYWPVCEAWQKSMCQLLGIRFVRGNVSHTQEHFNYSINHFPAVTGRSLGDGNCSFRALAFLLTGSQDDHIEFRTLITTYIAHNAGLMACLYPLWRYKCAKKLHTSRALRAINVLRGRPRSQS